MNALQETQTSKKLPTGLSVLLVLVILAGSVAACTDKSDFKEAGVKIVEMTTAWGGTGNTEDGQDSERNAQNDEHTFTYTITLFNGEDSPVYVAWARPVLAETVLDHLLTETLRVPLEEEIDAGVTLEVAGELRFRFEGMSKEQIDALGPVLEGLDVATERVLELPGQSQPQGTPVEGQVENSLKIHIENED